MDCLDFGLAFLRAPSMFALAPAGLPLPFYLAKVALLLDCFSSGFLAAPIERSVRVFFIRVMAIFKS